MSLVQIPTNKSTNLDIIKLVQGGEFTDEDAERNKELVSQDAYPWLYNTGNDPNSCLILKSRCQLVDSSTIRGGEAERIGKLRGKLQKALDTHRTKTGEFVGYVPAETAPAPPNGV